ncbi:MAG: sulfotransferase, partial [Microcoleaceae cyanobacterium]
MESTQNSSILIIAGMHRSGTSLTASILQSAGLHIGRKLLDQSHGASERNFENLDFFEFHKAVLRSQGVNEDGWTLQETIEVEDRFVEEAKELVAKNAVSAVWGWKEPRTTLFLKFWANLLPEAKFLLLYRFPWEVVDSLYRRGDPIFKSQPDLAVKIWLHYNQKLLNLHNKYSERCFLVDLHIFLNHLDTVTSAINQKLQLNLATPSSTLYKPSQIHKQSIEGHRASLIAYYFPEAIEMYRELEARAWQVNDTPDFSWIEQLKNTPYRTWAFQDWIQLGNWEGEKSKLQQELESSRSQLQQNQAELESNRSQLQQTQTELEQSRSQLQQNQAELELNRSQLQQTQT